MSIVQHPNHDPLYSLKQASEYTGISMAHLARLANSREIPVFRAFKKQGSPIRFRLSALNAYIRAHESRVARTPRS